MQADIPGDPRVLAQVVQSIGRRRAEITEQYVQVLQRRGSRLAWDSVMLDQLRGQVERVLDDTVAMLRGGASAEAAQQPDPASVEIGAHHARCGVHIAESLQAARMLFTVALEGIVDDLGATAERRDAVGQLSVALNDSIWRRVTVVAKAYFATWLDQVHSARTEQRLRIMRELTDASRDQLVGAIYSVMYEDRVTLTSKESSAGRLRPAGVGRPVLTQREREVLQLAAKAMTTRQIAEVLYIAEGTVRRHLGSAYKKLGAAGRLDAVNQAVAAGLIRPAAALSDAPGLVPLPREPA